MDSTNIYVLRLEDGYYYVGKANNVYQRFSKHVNGTAASWTKLHIPIEISNIYYNVSPFEEDMITKELMSIHGIDKVRGGSYVEETLPIDVIKLIKREIWATQDRCLRCGRKGHFIASCSFQTDMYGKYVESKNITIRSRLASKSPSSKSFYMKDKKNCNRCGRNSHIVENCYATTYFGGGSIPIKKYSPMTSTESSSWLALGIMSFMGLGLYIMLKSD